MAEPVGHPLQERAQITVERPGVGHLRHIGTLNPDRTARTISCSPLPFKFDPIAQYERERSGPVALAEGAAGIACVAVTGGRAQPRRRGEGAARLGEP